MTIVYEIINGDKWVGKILRRKGSDVTCSSLGHTFFGDDKIQEAVFRDQG